MIGGIAAAGTTYALQPGPKSVQGAVQAMTWGAAGGLLGSAIGAAAGSLAAAAGSKTLGAVANKVVGNGVSRPGGSAAATTGSDVPTPYSGQSLYRVYGGDSKAGGASWSPVNPSTVSNYRDAAGLPSGGSSGYFNSGRFVLEGTLTDPSKVVKTRSAVELDGMRGGLPEYIIPGWQDSGAVRLTRVSGANPEF